MVRLVGIFIRLETARQGAILRRWCVIKRCSLSKETWHYHEPAYPQERNDDHKWPFETRPAVGDESQSTCYDPHATEAQHR